MLVSDLFRTLSYGELANLAISGEGSGDIVAGSRDRVVNLTNQALTRFNREKAYKRGYVKIMTSSGQETYTLVPGASFLVENTPGEFQASLMKIVSVTRLDDPDTVDDEGYELSLNERNSVFDERAARIIGADTILFPSVIDGATYEVEYRAKPTLLTLPANLAETIDIPVVLEDALVYEVASKIYAGMNGDFTTIRANELKAMVRDELALVDFEDLLAHSEIDGRDRLRDKGFV